MNITIKDVAKEAGVSIATVSKVIHEKPSISDATRAHVLQVMEQLDYHPNAQASNFARKCSENIIFLAVTEPHVAFHNPHMFAILCGAQDKIREKNYNFSFIGVPDKDTACKKAKEIIGRRSADGLLIHGSASACLPAHRERIPTRHHWETAVFQYGMLDRYQQPCLRRYGSEISDPVRLRKDCLCRRP